MYFFLQMNLFWLKALWTLITYNCVNKSQTKLSLRKQTQHCPMSTQLFSNA